MKRFKAWLGEFTYYNVWSTGLRSLSRFLTGAFFPTRPMADKTVINYDMARQLYRNDAADTSLGAGFCKPIIDCTVEFMGTPFVSSDDTQIDESVNIAIDRYWKHSFVEIFRNALRDSKTWVRVWQPMIDDPLVTMEERDACQLEVIDPERVQSVVYDPQNPQRIAQVTIVSFVLFPDEVQGTTDAPRGAKAQVKEHEIWEIITPDRHRYYDRTARQWKTEWERRNVYGFVPMVEVFNEYDSTLSGGQSDLESVYPFVKAFHEALRQTLQAHAYHSTPKLRFKIADVLTFLRNNFPDAIDETGKVIPGSAIQWKGREVLFIGADEDIDFIKIDNVLGDSKTLMEFLIDCIAISSETPEWAFMRVEGGAASQGAVNAQTIPFEKKIERKRNQFQTYIQEIVKMMLAINGQEPIQVEVVWNEQRAENLLNLAQSLQQFVMTLEVLLERKLISENTAREALRQFRLFKTMKMPEEEAKDAQGNVSLDQQLIDKQTEAEIKKAKAIPSPVLPSGNGNQPTRAAATSRAGSNN